MKEISKFYWKKEQSKTHTFSKKIEKKAPQGKHLLLPQYEKLALLCNFNKHTLTVTKTLTKQVSQCSALKKTF